MQAYHPPPKTSLLTTNLAGSVFISVYRHLLLNIFMKKFALFPQLLCPLLYSFLGHL